MPAPLVLLANAQEWFSRALESILRPAGYSVLKAYTADDALGGARHMHPDAVVLDTELPEVDALDLCRVLRVDPGITASTPIILTTPGPASRAQVLAALRAGASDLWGQPLDTEECLLRLEGFLRAKEDADRARGEGLIDEPTGLYNANGLERRVRELAAEADRRGVSLACLALTPELPPPRSRERAQAGTTYDPQVESLGRLLKSAGRMSDAIGRLGSREFAVLAPQTDADGVVGLGERLQWVARATAREPGAGPLRLRGGYDTTKGFRSRGFDPAALLTRALEALREAEQSAGNGWLYRFEAPSGPRAPRA